MRAHLMPVSPMYDRAAPLPRAEMQCGFISGMVLPLWAQLAHPALAGLLDVREVVAAMRANLARYKGEAERERAARLLRDAAAEADAAAATVVQD